MFELSLVSARRAWLLGALCLLSLAACVAVDPGVAPSTGSTIPVADGWQPGETLVSRASATGTPYSYRTGITKTGLHYFIYGDGTGTISRTEDTFSSKLWAVNCRIDAMNDRKDCEIFGQSSPLLIDYRLSDRPSLICVQGHDFPGRTALIRVDGSAPIRTGENGCVTATRDLVERIRNAHMVSTRKVHWPYDQNMDEQRETVGLGDAMDLLSYIRDRL